MRFFLALCLMLDTYAALAAATDVKPQSYAEQLDKSNIEFLRQLSKNVEDAGYKHVQIVPEMFVVLVERGDGKRIVLIVNSNTLKAVEVEGGLEALTAGVSDIAPPETSVPKLH
jgi:hypothetical protein